MKALRFLAALMFLITGVIHLYLAIADPSDPNFLLALIFGVIYFAIGVLLILNKKLALWLGLIPIIPFAMAPFMLDFNNLDWTFSMFPIELIAVVCCVILLINKSKA